MNKRSRSNGTRSRSKRTENDQPVVSGLREIARLIKDQTDMTQNKSAPRRRDIQPMRAPARSQIFTFEKAVDKGFVTATNTTTTGALVFALSDIQTPTDLTSCFDQYRIVQVRVEFLPLSANFGASTTTTTLPYLMTAIDTDDGTPVSTATLQQNDTLETISNQTYSQRVLTPRAALGAYTGLTFTASVQTDPLDWIDSASDAQYYGLKWATTPVTVVSGNYDLFAISCHYIIQVRNPI
jgi:hypothetical protein